jgi:hypothetical protein
MQVPRHCPLVLLIKAGVRQSKEFGSGDGKAMRNEARKEVYQGVNCMRSEF